MKMQKYYDVNKRIAIYIISAQIASDAGKGIHDVHCKNQVSRSPEKFGYKCKTSYILKAMKLIRSNKSEFNYYISGVEGDQNGYPSVIVYFDFKVCNERHQISFHTPLSQVTAEMRAMCESGRKTRWRKNHESSREAAEILIKEYQLAGTGNDSNKKHRPVRTGTRPYGNARERK